MCCNRARPQRACPLPSSGASVARPGWQSDQRGPALTGLPQCASRRHSQDQPGMTMQPLGTPARGGFTGAGVPYMCAPRRLARCPASRTESAFGACPAAQCPENPVALCDGHGALLVAASEILVTAHTGRRRGPAQDQAVRRAGCSGSLAEASHAVRPLDLQITRSLTALTSHFGVAQPMRGPVGLGAAGWRRSADHDRRSLRELARKGGHAGILAARRYQAEPVWNL
jgi:hypothetical protein